MQNKQVVNWRVEEAYAWEDKDRDNHQTSGGEELQRCDETSQREAMECENQERDVDAAQDAHNKVDCSKHGDQNHECIVSVAQACIDLL